MNSIFAHALYLGICKNTYLGHNQVAVLDISLFPHTMCWDMWARLIYRRGSLFRGLGGQHSWSPGTGSSRLVGEACGSMGWCLMLGEESEPHWFAEKLGWAEPVRLSISKPTCSTNFFRPCSFLPLPTTKLRLGEACVLTMSLLPSPTLWRPAVWPGESYFCLWSSVPSFNNSDNNIYHNHIHRSGMFIMC
jgi:hypothetical protein